MGLGSLSDVSLADARELAREAHQHILRGDDPIELRKRKVEALKLEQARHLPFEQAATRYIATHKSAWKDSSKSAGQWEASLRTYAYPKIGSVSVREIDTSDILRVLEPIWQEKQETARRVRQRCENIIDWATSRGLRTGENPARWKGHLENLLAGKKKRNKRHMEAMPYVDVPAFMAELRTSKVISGKALEFCILTAARTSEVIGALWSEIDLEERVWTVPGERIKAGRPHKVPLSDRAVALLRALPRERDNTPFLFIGARAKRGLSNMAMLAMLKERFPSMTVHGFRSSFRDWAAEQTNFQREVCEAALAHTIPNAVEAAYRRGDLFEKRRKLMAAWSTYCQSSPVKSAKVIPIGKKK
jgi:integrase